MVFAKRSPCLLGLRSVGEDFILHFEVITLVKVIRSAGDETVSTHLILIFIKRLLLISLFIVLNIFVSQRFVLTDWALGKLPRFSI